MDSLKSITLTLSIALDIRSDNDKLREQALQAIQDQVADLCQHKNLTHSWEEIHNASAVACASWLQNVQTTVLENMGLPPIKLISGAGHDAMAFAGVTDIATYFLRCKGGVSHHPDELVYVDDVQLALQGLVNTLLALDKQQGFSSYSHAFCLINFRTFIPKVT